MGPEYYVQRYHTTHAERTRYQTDANRPINDQDIFDAIYTVVLNTRLFYNDCDN